METLLINVDLELYSLERLKDIGDELKGKVYTLYEGESGEGYMYSAEVSKGGGVDSIEEIINKFLKLLSLIKNQELLDNCTNRVFNIGVETGTEPRYCEFFLPNAVMKNAAKSGFSITFTVYGYDSENEV